MRIPLQFKLDGDSADQRISVWLVTSTSLLAFFAIVSAHLSFRTSAQLVAFPAPPESIQIACEAPSCGPNQQVFLSRESPSDVQQFYQSQAGPFETSPALPTQSSSRLLSPGSNAKPPSPSPGSNASSASSSRIVIDWKSTSESPCAGPLFANLRSIQDAFPAKQEAFANLCDRYGYLDSAYFKSVPASADTPDSLVPADELIASHEDEDLRDSLTSNENSARESMESIQLALLTLDGDQVVASSQKLAAISAEIQTTCETLWNQEAQKLEDASLYAYRTKITIIVRP